MRTAPMKNTFLNLALAASCLVGVTACKELKHHMHYRFHSAQDLKADLAKVGIELVIDPAIINEPIVSYELQCLTEGSSNQWGCTGFNDLKKDHQYELLTGLKQRVRKVVITLTPGEVYVGQLKQLELYNINGDFIGPTTTLSNTIHPVETPDPALSFENGVLTIPLTYSVHESSVFTYKVTDRNLFNSISSDTDAAFIQGLESGAVNLVNAQLPDNIKASKAFYSDIRTLMNATEQNPPATENTK